MGLKSIVTAFAVAAALAVLALPAGAAPKKKTVVVGGNVHTVGGSRDEEGRTHTRIIIQKRSYLDPGNEQFPGEGSVHDYAWKPNHRADGVIDNTIFGGNLTALPGPFPIPLKDNPWVQY